MINTTMINYETMDTSQWHNMKPIDIDNNDPNWSNITLVSSETVKGLCFCRSDQIKKKLINGSNGMVDYWLLLTIENTLTNKDHYRIAGNP